MYWSILLANNLVKLRSKFEDKIKASCPKLRYESISLDYTVDYTYKPDFVLTTKNKHQILIECKGGNSFKYFNGAYRKKWLAMRQCNLNKDIRLIFEKDFKIGKKMRVSDWCSKNNIKYHIGSELPKSWLSE